MSPVVSITISGSIVEQDGESIVLVLISHLNEWRDEETFYFGEVCSHAPPCREIRNSRAATIHFMRGSRVRYDRAKAKPSEGINFQVRAGSFRDPSPAKVQAGS
jgi:hypothetical protein